MAMESGIMDKLPVFRESETSEEAALLAAAATAAAFNKNESASDATKQLFPSVNNKEWSRTLLETIIPKLMADKSYDTIIALFKDQDPAYSSESTEPSNKYLIRNRDVLPEIAMELFKKICVPNLNSDIHTTEGDLYNCVDELLKMIVFYGPVDELLLELVDLVEECSSFDVYSSLLHSLQLLLKRRYSTIDQNPRPLQWTLNSISLRLQSLELPGYLYSGYDEKQIQLLEQNDQIQIVLMHYITINYFYDELLKQFVQERTYCTEGCFYDYGFTMCNIICYNLIDLLGTKSLSLFDLARRDVVPTSNLYSFQCATTLTQNITKCIRNPFNFLYIIKERIHRAQFPVQNYKKSKQSFVENDDSELDNDEGDSITSKPMNNPFLNDEFLKMDALGVYYYMILVQKIDYDCLPKIYSPMYVFECGLYLAKEMLSREEPAVQEKSLKLIEFLINHLGNRLVPVEYLELNTFQKYLQLLCNRISYSKQLEIRKNAISTLRMFILQFVDEGKYLIITNLLRTIEHQGITGYLIMLYKDLVAGALIQYHHEDDGDKSKIPSIFTGADFRSLFLHYICRLPNGAKTDLLEHSDKIISSLNVLRYIALSDRKNLTGYWSIVGEIQTKYLNIIKECLELSEAHFKAEQRMIEKMTDQENEVHSRKQKESLKMLNISIAQNSNDYDGHELENNMMLSRQDKLNILKRNLCTFDLIRSLLVRVNECIESYNNPA